METTLISDVASPYGCVTDDINIYITNLVYSNEYGIYIIKINIADNTTRLTYQIINDNSNIGCLAIDTSYLYIPYENNSVGYITWINISNMTKNNTEFVFRSYYVEDEFGNSNRENVGLANGLVVAGNFLYASSNTKYGVIARFQLRTNIIGTTENYNDITFGDNDGYNNLDGLLTGSYPKGLTTDGTYLYIGCLCKIIRMHLDDLTGEIFITNLSGQVNSTSILNGYIYACLSNNTVMKINMLLTYDRTIIIVNGLYNPVGCTISGNDLYITNFVIGSSNIDTDNNDGFITKYSIGIPSTDTSLNTFTINSIDVGTSGGSTVSVPYGTTTVYVCIITSSSRALISVNNSTPNIGSIRTFIPYLLSGLNTLIITVVAEDGVTTANYSAYVNVESPSTLSRDTTLTNFTINGMSVNGINGENITIPYGTTSVDVNVVTSSSQATISINNSSPTVGTNTTTISNFVTGSNTVAVTVVAEDGTTSYTYYAYVTVGKQYIPSTDTSLISFTINGMYVKESESNTVSVAYGTTSVPVYVSTTSQSASISINGDTSTTWINSTTISGLVTGSNTITGTIVAEDGTTTDTYTAYIVVENQLPPSSDTSLSSFIINGTYVGTSGDDSVNVAYNTTSVSVYISTTSQKTSISINGDTSTTWTNSTTISDLVTGLNPVSVTVVAEDGMTSNTYTSYIYVEDETVLSTDTTLNVLTINSINVDPSGGSISVPYGTTMVYVYAVATSSTALVSVNNGTQNIGEISTFVSYLVIGVNTLTITVVAEDRITTTNYTVYVDVESPSTLSRDTSLTTFTINGMSLNIINGANINVPYGTNSVIVNVVTTSSQASISINDGIPTIGTNTTTISDLILGSNTITVTVVAQDGTTTYTYYGYVTVENVYIPSANTSLITFTINGMYVKESESNTVRVLYGTSSVPVYVSTTSQEASIRINGGTPTTWINSTTISGLVTGSNTLTVFVVAEDEITTHTYSAYIIVENQLPPSSDTTLYAFIINNIHVNNGNTVNVAYGTIRSSVYVSTNSQKASISINGDTPTIWINSTTVYGLVTGSNTVSVTVVAEDGITSNTYTAYIYVENQSPLYSNTTLTTFTINHVNVGTSGGGTASVPYGTTMVYIYVVATSSTALVTVNNGTPNFGTISTFVSYLVTGLNTVTVTVVAEDGVTTTNYTAYVNVEDPPIVPCFGENTKILCLNREKNTEEYISIKDIRKGTLVKTLLNCYLEVCIIGKSTIQNYSNNDRIKNRLYKCTKQNYPEIIDEDLIITGCHSILVDYVNDEQREKTIKELGCMYITDKKYRLFAFLDSRAETYQINAILPIYHIALENENYYKNYGIYANGLLVETCSKRYLKELSNMILIQ